ncbi:MAG: cysteine desulfurase [Sphingobacteriales bacterium]|jgi:cysteine desulfurase/selenocysteine lyase|nr:cysteine desulfurase [Sphingobacteriales bacterium]
MNAFDPGRIRADFPILSERPYGKPLIYFDNAASSQKPKSVIDAITEYYSHSNANIHRGVHYLSQKASEAYDAVRVALKDFLNAPSEDEIVFVRGTTEAVNLVAATFGRTHVQAGDEVLISAMEHHSNIVPWQMLCEEKGAKLRVIPIDDHGQLRLDQVDNLITERTRIVSLVHVSNSLGTINPVKEVIRLAHAKGVPVFVDGAQSTAHFQVDVQDLDADFFAFSGHKILGPTGIGVLYGKRALLESMPPYQGGGEMIRSVSFERTTYNDIPLRFEAGTPNIAGVIALGEALRYWESIDRDTAVQWENTLLAHATVALQGISGVQLIGTAAEKASVLSFVIDEVNALDAGMYLDTKGIAVRTGHHCTEPVMHRFGIPGTIRASFMFYNTLEEIDEFVNHLHGAIRLLRPLNA